MAYNSKEIIAYIEKDYPTQGQHVAIKNCSDLKIESQIKPLNQYIIGVTPSDPLSNDIRHYESRMKQKLESASPYYKCLPWSFYGNEIEEMKTTLKELSEYFEANLDLDLMTKNINIKNDDRKMYFIVITIVQYPIIYVE